MKRGLPALLLIAWLLILSEARGPLSGNLKLDSKNKDIKRGPRDIKTFKELKANRESQKFRLQQDEPPEPIFIDYKKPFTVSPEYAFFDNFMVGIKLETFFKGSDACIQDLVYFADDVFYLQNNVTDFTIEAFEAPVMNFTKMLAGNFSNALVDCEYMGTNIYAYGLNKFSQFNNNIGDFLLSFLFNMMGSALKFKSAFTAINDDMKNGNFEDIATQYGRMIRIIFDFEPVATAGLSTALFGSATLIPGKEQ